MRKGFFCSSAPSSLERAKEQKKTPTAKPLRLY